MKDVDLATIILSLAYIIGLVIGVTKCSNNIGGFMTEARPQGDCENCFSLSETFGDGVVEVMNKNDIASIERLSEMLKGGSE